MLNNKLHQIINMYLFSLSKNFRVLSEWEQSKYCKALSIANDTMWHELNVILSTKFNYKMLPFLVCSIMNYDSRNLPYLFQQFTSDKKQDIAIIHIQIITFYSTIMKYINTHYILESILLNLPSIKPK